MHSWSRSLAKGILLNIFFVIGSGKNLKSRSIKQNKNLKAGKLGELKHCYKTKS